MYVNLNQTDESMTMIVIHFYNIVLSFTNNHIYYMYFILLYKFLKGYIVYRPIVSIM